MGAKERAPYHTCMNGLGACFEAVPNCKEGSLLVCIAHATARKQGKEGLHRRTGLGLKKTVRQQKQGLKGAVVGIGD